ncbi:MAG TPA: cytochrome c oxidase subunit 3 [Burkholderiales bacterium]|nr:cytochrome c oxidase subunit 3 [Burkholderiales bacterium]
MNHADRYYVPPPSHYPILGAAALLLLALGAALWVNGSASGPWVSAGGAAVLGYMLFGWFGTVVRESTGGRYGAGVDRSFRWGMAWFIFSEVMFFAAFFGALFYVRVLGLPDLSSAEHQELLWKGFEAQWPERVAPAPVDPYTPMQAWGIPALNTVLLLSSAVTVTWAHWGLLAGRRARVSLGLVLTLLLGAAFLGLQAYEYGHAYRELNLTLSSAVYGSLFFFLTGFHGLHVTVGAIMLAVILARVMAGHFRPDDHFAFEAAAWYWHFVDVVWLFLFVTVYWI